LSATDTLARILAEHLRTSLGQPVIIENVSGAGGSIGVGRVARAAPQLQYDVVQDFEPVSLIADTPQWIVARKTLPAKDLRELIAWLKESPGKAMAGTVGVGGGGVIARIYFQKSTGTSFQLVPYRGAAPLYQDMLAGHIDFSVGQAASTFVPRVEPGGDARRLDPPEVLLAEPPVAARGARAELPRPHVARSGPGLLCTPGANWRPEQLPNAHGSASL